MTLYDQIKSLVDIKDNPKFAEYDTVKKVLYVTNQLSGALIKLWDALQDGDTLDTAELVDAMERLFEDYIVPIDLPINDLLERVIEAQIPKSFEPLILAIKAKLNA